MRFLVVLVSLVAALSFVAASGLMNWVFMTSLGKTGFERLILGAVSVAVSAFLALLPTLLLWAHCERRALYIILGVPVFLAFAAFSLSSAVGFAAKNRGSISEDRALASTKLEALKHEIAEAEVKRNAFGHPKPLSVVQEALRGLEQDRRWQSSKACQDATADALRAFCRGYFELKAEAAAATETLGLDSRISELKTKMRRLEDQGAGREADNQAAVLARVFGLEAAKVERGLTFFLAALVEIGAALGLYFATGPMRAESRRRGSELIEAGVVKHVADKGRRPVKLLTGPLPRRVPHQNRS